MAFYATKCAECTDASRRCVKPAQGGDREGALPEMYECDNETCKLNAARLKGVRQLQAMKAAGLPLHDEGGERRGSHHAAGGQDRRGRRDHRRR